MILLLKTLLVISLVESRCGWKGQKTKPFEEADFFKKQIPIYWKTLVSNPTCIKKMIVEQKRGDISMKITQVFRSQLKTLGKEPLRVLNAFGNCSSALYILEIEMTDDQDRKHKFKRIFDPMKQLELFEEKSLVKTNEVKGGGLQVFWKEGGMFTKCPQLLKCVAGVNIMNRNGVSLKKIKIQNEKSWLPPKYLNECETFEVQYHFFQKQPRIKKANITYPSKEQCAQRKPEISEPRRPGFQIEV